MRLRYSPRATRDLDAIHEYLAKRSPGGAINVMTAIFASVEFIRRHPEAAPAVSNIAGVRGVMVHRYRFKFSIAYWQQRRLSKSSMSATHRGEHGPARWIERPKLEIQRFFRYSSTRPEHCRTRKCVSQNRHWTKPQHGREHMATARIEKMRPQIVARSSRDRREGHGYR